MVLSYLQIMIPPGCPLYLTFLRKVKLRDICYFKLYWICVQYNIIWIIFQYLSFCRFTYCVIIFDFLFYPKVFKWIFLRNGLYLKAYYSVWVFVIHCFVDLNGHLEMVEKNVFFSFLIDISYWHPALILDSGFIILLTWHVCAWQIVNEEGIVIITLN